MGKLSMIKLTNIFKEYPVGTENLIVLNNISLTIKEKEFVGILGSSGSGKSTLMHIIGLLDKPTRGKVIINGKDIGRMSDDNISTLRNEYVGFVFQQFNLIDKLTVLENIVLPAIYAKKPLTYNPREKAYELMKRFGIYERKDFYPNRISGGQQQRVAIARALIMNPKLVLADEPTGNLDTRSGNEILSLLKELNRDLGVTVIIVTHEKHVARKTQRQIFIRDGKIVKKYS